ncbi:MAG: pimeloyl-ACP methyl ester esterase BioH [Gammaproteobacteria bacterium]|nr:pimeloyl-ACP methyl ester esterase BioH [Gammaproteobacteria bacterium]
MKLYSTTRGQGRDLVLLHGWGFHSGIWGDFAERLAQHYRVTLIDLPGFGQSPMLDKPYTLENVSAAVLEVSPLQAIFIGWSLGGLIATAIAIYHRQRHLGLLNLCSSPCFIEGANWPGISLFSLEQFSQGLRVAYEKTLLRFLLLQAPGLSRVALLALKQEVLRYPPSEAALFAGLSLLENTDLRHYLHNSKDSSLYILGGLDALIPVKMAAYLPQFLNAQINIIEKAGHAPFISHPSETLELIKGWIDG